MLKTRIITAVFLLAGLLCALFFFPPMAWIACCALICAVAAWEWGGLAGWNGRARTAYAAILGIACFALGFPMGLAEKSAYAALWLSGAQGGAARDAFMEVWLHGALSFELLAVAFWLLIVPFWLKYKWPLRVWSAAATGVLVLLPPTFVFMVLRHFDPVAVLVAAATVWVADTAAYFSGRAFGKRKLAPSISPGKTWAGAAGATLGVMLYGSAIFIAAARGVSAGMLVPLVLLQPLLIGLSALSIAGDLFESLLKRQAGVKDSSSLLPGHGGVLDRIDSLTSTLPMAGLFPLILCFY
ncbi:MAG: phosphatidate cytidylyltransferase [Azoarcus sp.]|jgi:phosphatidate cytidylyltransferase|nr:phosphatidate cytidylyltransferase [Azoarcus sp.]